MKHTTIILAIALLVGCKKEPSKGNITFYQLSIGKSNPSLYVDDVRRGFLNKIQQQPVCGDNVANKIITIELSYGEHQFWLDDGTTTWRKYYLTVSESCKTIKIE